VPQGQPAQVFVAGYSVQVGLLVRGGIWIVRRLIRCSAPEKIKSHNSPDGRKIWKKAIVEMKIIRKAVHQVDRRLFARIFSDVNAIDLAARTVP
jgi:hypothetical protein